METENKEVLIRQRHLRDAGRLPVEDLRKITRFKRIVRNYLKMLRIEKSTAVLTAILLLFLPGCSVKESATTHVQPGETIPAFSAFLSTGQNVSSEELLGRPSVIILFDTTCPDCHRQLPEVQEAFDAAGEGTAFLAVSRKEDPQAVTSFWKTKNLTLPVVIEKGPEIYRLFDRESRSGVPQLYIADPSGTVIHYSGDERTVPASEILKTINQ